jgi:hypothetical protein
MILILILYFLAGVTNSIMDRIRNSFEATIFSNLKGDYWNPEKSWTYKWKNGDPRQGERFLFSSTILVFATDGWHLCKWIMFTLIEVAICWAYGVHPIYIPLSVLALKTARGLGFNPFYEKILMKK